jgi:hypothetical protein
MQLLRRIGLVVNVDDDTLPFFQSNERTRELSIVGRCRDDAGWCKFDESVAMRMV